MIVVDGDVVVPCLCKWQMANGTLSSQSLLLLMGYVAREDLNKRRYTRDAHEYACVSAQPCVACVRAHALRLRDEDLSGK